MERPIPELMPALTKAFDIVHAPLLLFFHEVVRECGGNPEDLLRQAGIPSNASEAYPIGYAELASLLELSARTLDRADFGMLLALRQCAGGIEGVLGHAMRHARRFDEMLGLTVKHSYAHSLASNSWLHRSKSGRWVLLGHDVVHEEAGVTRQLMEQILLIGHLTVIRLTGGAVHARRIILRHERLSALHIYRRYFGCEVRFGQRAYATFYRSDDMARPILSADISVLRNDIAEIETRFSHKRMPLSRKVRGAILHAIDDGPCTGERIAGQLGLHVRSLHRHLAREGTSFRRIKDEVRRDLAGYYLRDTDLDMKAISERLGFSEQSVLSRRARKWFASSPTDLRAGRIGAGRIGDGQNVRLGQVRPGTQR